MIHLKSQQSVFYVLCGLVCWFTPVPARGDGGMLCLSEQKDGYQIAVFASPNPPRAGLIDFSTLIQNVATQETISNADVTLIAAQQDKPNLCIRAVATTEAATNKLFQASTLNLSRPGLWHLQVCVDGPLGKTDFEFDLKMAEPLPKYKELWPWLAWPAVPILMFSWSQCLAKRSSRTHRH